MENAPSGVHELLELEYAAWAEVVRATSDGALDLLATADVDAALIASERSDVATSVVVHCLKERGVPFVVFNASLPDTDNLLDALDQTRH